MDRVKFVELFSNYLANYLTKTGYNAAQVAKKLGVNRSLITRWGNGASVPGIENLQKISNLFELDDGERKALFEAAGKGEYIKSEKSLSHTLLPKQETLQDIVSKPRVIPTEKPPAAPPYFTGREEEIKQVTSKLQPGVVISLQGAGGMGKTALARKIVDNLELTNELLQRFPDGTIFYSFYGGEIQSKSESALEHIVRSFGEEPKPSPTAAAQRVLPNRTMLLILDGTEWADDLRGIVGLCSNQCGVLITTQRKEFIGRDLVEIEIDSLPFNYAYHLLRTLGGVYASDESTMQKLYKLTGGLTLAIELIGHYLHESQKEDENNDILDYLNWLEKRGLEALNFGKRRLASIPVLLDRSISHVSEVAQHLLVITGILALDSIDRDVLAAALGIEAVDLMYPLWELTIYSLLTREEERYRIRHRLIHTYAREEIHLPEAHTVRDNALIRLATFYAQFAKEQIEVGVSGHQRLNLERTHIIAVLTECMKHGKWEAALKLTTVLHLYFYNQNFLTDSVVIYEAALASARALGMKHDEIAALANMGTMYSHLGELTKAADCFQQGVTLARKLDDHRREIMCLHGLGLIQYNLGHLTQAIEYFQQTLRVARNVNDHTSERESLFALGTVYQRLGQPQQAAEFFHQAIEIARENGDDTVSIKDRYLLQLAFMYQLTGEVSKAIECYQECLTIARASGDRQNEGVCLSGLGALYQKSGQLEQAADYYQQALALAHEVGMLHVEGVATSNLGIIYYELGELERAIESYKLALIAARQLNNKLTEKFFLDAIGSVYYQSNQPHRALEYYQQALPLIQEVESVKDKVKTYSGLANTYLQLRQLDEAEQYYKLRVEISPDTGFFAFVGLGIIARRQGRGDEANEYFERALTVWNSTLENYPESAASLYECRAVALLCLGQEEEALNSLQTSIPHRQKNYTFDVTDFELLAEAPNSPDGLSRLRSLYEESFKSNIT